MIFGILLAAGMGRRMGIPKALVQFGDHTLHARGVALFRVAGLEVIVVANPAVAAALPPARPGEWRVVNECPDHESGMFGSVQMGVLDAMARGASGAILLPVDFPLVSADDVLAIAASLDGGASIVVATHRSRRGHPVGMSRPIMGEVMAAKPGTTLRDLVRKDPVRVSVIEVSEGAILGVNTKDELERLLAMSFR